MQSRLAALSCALVLFAPTSAFAQVLACTLLAVQEGELAPGADLMGWRTTRPAVVDATTTVPSILYVNTPSGWALHPARTPGASFSVAAQLSGANGGQLAPGGGGVSGQLTTSGTTHAAVSLTATATSPFPAGVYSAEVTVTCVPR